jgi:hypothetical protein
MGANHHPRSSANRPETAEAKHMNATPGPSKEVLQVRVIPPAALLGFACAAINQIGVSQVNDWALWISSLSFAIAILLFVAWTIIAYNDYTYTIQSDSWYVTTNQLAGVLCVAAGLGALVWHVSWKIGDA